MDSRPVLQHMKPYIAGTLVPGKLKLSSNENPLGPSPKAKEAYLAAAEDLSLYPDGSARILKETLAAHYGVEPSQVLLGNGSDETIVMLAATFVNPGDHVLVGEHTFSEYRFATRLLDGEPEAIPMPQGSFSLETIRERLRPYTRMVYICSPNNPTGAVFPLADLEALLTEAGPRTLVVWDAAYGEYVHEGPASPRVERDLLGRHPNLVVLHTFSKLYGLAGLRVGYALASTETVQAMEKVRQPFNVNLPAQRAAVAALGDHDFVALTLDMNRRGLVQLQEGLDRLGLPWVPSQGNFICFETPWPAADLYQKIMDHGVTVRPLGSFGLPRSIRVTVGTEAMNRTFLQALEAALGDLGRA